MCSDIIYDSFLIWYVWQNQDDAHMKMLMSECHSLFIKSFIAVLS